MKIDEIEKIYQTNLQLAQEEGNNELSMREAHNLATDWTVDDITNYVVKICEDIYWEKQDLINKNFYG